MDAPFPAPSEAGAFASAVGAAAMGNELGYEAAAASGYAPAPKPLVVPAGELAEDGMGPQLPNFGAEPPPGDRPLLKRPDAPLKPPADGKLFDMGALEDNLDELFAGLGAGAAPKGPPGSFDEFGLTRPVPVPPGRPEAAGPAPGLMEAGVPPLAAPGPIGLDDPFGGPDPFKPAPPEPEPPPPSLEAPPAPPTLGPVAAAGPPPRPLMPTGATGTLVDPDAAYRPPTPSVGPDSLRQATPTPPAPVAASSAPAPAKAAGGWGPAPMMSGGPAPSLLPLAASGQLKRALDALEHLPGVAGALVVGDDGLGIASSLPPSFDAESLGAQLGSLFHDLGGRLGSQGRGGLRRVVLETEQGVLVVCAADMGILVVVSHEGQAMDGSAVWAALTGALGLGA